MAVGSPTGHPYQVAGGDHHHIVRIGHIEEHRTGHHRDCTEEEDTAADLLLLVVAAAVVEEVARRYQEVVHSLVAVVDCIVGMVVLGDFVLVAVAVAVAVLGALVDFVVVSSSQVVQVQVDHQVVGLVAVGVEDHPTCLWEQEPPL